MERTEIRVLFIANWGTTNLSREIVNDLAGAVNDLDFYLGARVE